MTGEFMVQTAKLIRPSKAKGDTEKHFVGSALASIVPIEGIAL